MMNMGKSPHQDLLDQTSQAPVGKPNDLLKFLFSQPGFLTDYQKDVIRSWMTNPTQQTPSEAPSGAGSPAKPNQPAGKAMGGMPAGAVGPAAAPKPVGAIKPA